MEKTTRSTGGCQCGALRFAVDGAPEHISVCYCRMCQKASGGPFMAMARFPAAAVSWVHGQPATFRSSSFATRGFCPACGTPLTYQRRPEALSLTTGSFDDPSAMLPTSRLGVESLLPWTDHLAELPSQTADDWLDSIPGVREKVVNHQHPDRDT